MGDRNTCCFSVFTGQESPPVSYYLIISYRGEALGRQDGHTTSEGPADPLQLLEAPSVGTEEDFPLSHGKPCCAGPRRRLSSGLDLP